MNGNHTIKLDSDAVEIILDTGCSRAFHMMRNILLVIKGPPIKLKTSAFTILHIDTRTIKYTGIGDNSKTVSLIIEISTHAPTLNLQ